MRGAELKKPDVTSGHAPRPPGRKIVVGLPARPVECSNTLHRHPYNTAVRSVARDHIFARKPVRTLRPFTSELEAWPRHARWSKTIENHFFV